MTHVRVRAYDLIYLTDHNKWKVLCLWRHEGPRSAPQNNFIFPRSLGFSILNSLLPKTHNFFRSFLYFSTHFQCTVQLVSITVCLSLSILLSISVTIHSLSLTNLNFLLIFFFLLPPGFREERFKLKEKLPSGTNSSSFTTKVSRFSSLSLSPVMFCWTC